MDRHEAAQRGVDFVPNAVVNGLCNSNFSASRNWVQPRDPLTLDLDGDGLETVGINPAAPILFDHDGDDVKTGTGWVSPDDGFLVLDRNGNGTIDSGIELFGDSTPLSGGGNAVDGFAALADQDSNSDSKVDATDARFADLRVWRDLNQDGISQINELATLTALNIVSLNVAKTENTTVLANGNVIADLGTYVKTDGTVGALGETAQLGDVDLADNPFYSQFTDTLPISAAAAALPDMQGSGMVRDLREAASQSGALQTLLAQYTTATTRDAQMALLDPLLDAWADTSGYAETLDDRAGGQYLIYYVGFGNVLRGAHYDDLPASGALSIAQERDALGIPGGEINYTGRDVDNDLLDATYRNTIAQWSQRSHVTPANDLYWQHAA